MTRDDGDLSFAEKMLCRQVVVGEMADVTSGDETETDPQARLRSRVVRGPWLRRLITGEMSGTSVHWRGLRLTGAQIEGSLDLEAATVDFPLAFERCSFDEPVILVDAGLRQTRFVGSDLAGLQAAGAHLRGDLTFGPGTVTTGVMDLVGAKIEGRLNCDGARMASVPRSLLADGLQVTGPVRLGVGGNAAATAFAAAGTVSLVGAQIGGDLHCAGGSLGGDPALNLNRARVAGDVFLGVTAMAGGVHRFDAAGVVTADWIQVGGSVHCSGGNFHGLVMDRARIKGSVYLGAVEEGGVQVFRSRRPVSVSLSVVDGAVEGRGGQFLGEDPTCLDLSDTSAQSVRLGAIPIGGIFRESVAAGCVSLVRAEVKGNISGSGGKFDGFPTAVNAQYATVGGAVRFGVLSEQRRTSTFRAKGEVNFLTATIGGDLDCRGGLFAAQACSLRADLATISGAVRLGAVDAGGHGQAFRAAGKVSLVDATIRSDLGCAGGNFEGRETSIDADGVSVGGKVDIGVIVIAGRSHPLTARGEIRFVDARIGNDLDGDGAQLDGPAEQIALRLDGADIGGQANLGTTKEPGQACSLQSSGSVSLVQSRIQGDLDCDGAKLMGRYESASLLMYGAKVGGTVYLGATGIADAVAVFRAECQVHAVRAVIGRSLVCDGGEFAGQDDGSLVADSITVAGAVYLGVKEIGPGYPFRASAGVSFLQASIGGDWDCRGGEFRGEECSLQADRATVARTIKLGVIETGGQVRQFTAAAEVSLAGVTTGDAIDCNGGEFHGRPRALTVDRAKVQGTVSMSTTKAGGTRFRFVADGEVSLTEAVISGDLACNGGEFRSPDSACYAPRMIVTGQLLLQTYGPLPRLNLNSARIGQISDDRSCWPPAGALDVEWLTYDGFAGTAPKTVRDRLAWLALQDGIPAQPYIHLAAHYGRLGDDKAARQVRMSREWRRLRRPGLGPAGKLANVVMGGTIGYGYRPGRAVFVLFLLYLVGVLLVYQPARPAMVAAKSPVPGVVVTAHDPCPPNYPCYSPWAYSFDVLVPVVHLGQADAWTPTGPSGTKVRYYGYAATVLGWALATMAVLGFTGLVRRT